MNLSDIKEKLNCSDKIEKLERRLAKNDRLAWLYYALSCDLEFSECNIPEGKKRFWDRRIEDIRVRSGRVALCSQYWKGNYYRLQGVKDLQTVNLCHDRFCDNCQNTIAVQRSEKYSPVLLRLADDFDIYHITFTVPNCTSVFLKTTVDKIYKSFQKLVQYFSGRKRIRSVDFDRYGYVGAIKAMEITKNTTTNTFHPHLHCLFLFKKGLKLDSKRRNINAYSFQNPDIKYSYHGDKVYAFSEFDIFLQKLWRLLYDGVEVNYSNLNELPLGYSVVCKNAKGNYKEVFKYATKGLLSADPNKSPIAELEDFETLFFTLYRRRLVQGYGCLYRLKFDEFIDLSADDLYISIITDLHFLENPDEFYETFDEVKGNIKHDENVTYISRKKIAQLMEKDYE